MVAVTQQFPAWEVRGIFARILSSLMLCVSGVLGSFGFIGLIDKIFGWNSLEDLSATAHDAIKALVLWWDAITQGAMFELAGVLGLQAETNTIAASVAMLLISSVGIKHFQAGLFRAIAKPEKKPRGRPHKDPTKRLVKKIRFYLGQKVNTVVEFFRTDTWITITMIMSYLLIVFAINLSATPIHPETIKGIAYSVLAYAGFHAIRSLKREESYMQYLGVMAGSSVVLVGASWYIQNYGLPAGV